MKDIDKTCLNFYRDDAELDAEDHILIPQRQFGRTKHADIYTRHFDKRYRAVYKKGQICPHMEVRPYGFVEPNI